MALYTFRTAVVDDLYERSKRAHPHNRVHQARWIRAARYLRRHNLWVLDRPAQRTRPEAA